MEKSEEREQDRFFAVPVATMQAGTLAPGDLFVRASANKLTLYGQAKTSLREEMIEKLFQDGIESLYMRESEQESYNQYVERNIETIVERGEIPRDKACRLVYERSSKLLEEMLADPRADSNLSRTRRIVKAIVRSILKDSDALWDMVSLAPDDYYTYTHCVNVGIFMVAASRQILDIRDRQALESVGLGGILHDIGKSKVPPELLTKQEKLTDEEFEKVKQHPLLGLDIVQKQKSLPNDSLRIIRWHHECYDGSGYPDGLTGDRLTELACLAGIVDSFDALTTNRPYAKARTAFEAAKSMMFDMNGHYHQNLLRAFIRFLGPK